MSVVINTNVDSLNIQNNLTKATSKLSTSMKRMSTGLKVMSAKDDAAGVVIAAKMQVQLDGNKIAQNNVQSGNAMFSTMEGSLDSVETNLVRIRDLALQAKNGTYSNEERKAMQDEVDQRVAEINRINGSAKYSSLQLFGGDDLKDGLTLQVGTNATADDAITVAGATFASVAFKDITKVGETEGVEKLDISSDSANFDTAIGQLDAAINNITGRKSTIGSVQNRLDSAYDTLTTQYENLSAAKSVITDADIAAEASTFTQQQILQQVSTSLLAQANQAPSIALSLV